MATFINDSFYENANFSGKTILITGIAGFIGFHLAKKIIGSSDKSLIIIGIDNINDYYDIRLKETRLSILNEITKSPENGTLIFIKGNLSNKTLIDNIFENYKPNIIVNLAAQAGVRYSITNPDAYIESNIIGFFNILEACRHSYDDGRTPVEHLIYASSSSVYGLNKKVPYSTEDRVDNPVSLYAATKKSNELFAHVYSKLYAIPSTGLRFFTVYGPYGRPDMAYFSFTNKLIRGEKIQIFNYGDMYRDFTYIDDIITGVVYVMNKIPCPNEDGVRYKVYNIGNSQPENLMQFISILEKCLFKEGIIVKQAEKEFLPMQQGDVYRTYADIEELTKDFGFKPSTTLEKGLSQYAKWYKEFYMK